MGLHDLVSSVIGLPNNLAGEVVIYTIEAILLLAVIEQILSLFRRLTRTY